LTEKRNNMDENNNNDFAEELDEMEHEAEDNELIKSLGDSINKQVEMEMEPLVPEVQDQNSSSGNEGEPPEEEKKGLIGILGKIPKWIYILSFIAIFIVVLVMILNASGLGEKLVIKIGSWFAAKQVDYEPVDQNNVTLMPNAAEDISEFMDKLTPIPTVSPTPTPVITQEPEKVQKDIVNILLLGEENIDSYSNRGRTDLIVLATIDIKNKAVKLTSIMRDSFVQIPGQQDNRINAAYALGGVPLLYSTIEKNFGIVPDNYALVRFDDFEKIVDSVGGIDIKLSKKEAAYLNRTNYISDPKNRTVVEGMNHMNGNQALGYCRVRYVAKDNEKNDFGRTSRHREVIEAIIAQLKNLSYSDLLRVGMECLPLVTTDVTSENIEDYTNMIVDIGVSNLDIQENRIPIEGSYKFVTIRKMSVTQIDIEKNREALLSFIYGEQAEKGENDGNTNVEGNS